MIEREKRWKLNGEIPPDHIKDKFQIEQTYAHTKPDVRVRKITRGDISEYSHCVKYILKNFEREEIEQKISKERYERILETIDKKPVIKNRTVIELDDGLLAEIDEFLDTGDKIVEVEFPTAEMMESFSPPLWFGEEIKSKRGFSYSVFAKINKISESIWD